jgi:hypothetical protein
MIRRRPRDAAEGARELKDGLGAKGEPIQQEPLPAPRGEAEV